MGAASAVSLVSPWGDDFGWPLVSDAITSTEAARLSMLCGSMPLLDHDKARAMLLSYHHALVEFEQLQEEACGSSHPAPN